jgi:hypothetical protein
MILGDLPRSPVSSWTGGTTYSRHLFHEDHIAETEEERVWSLLVSKTIRRIKPTLRLRSGGQIALKVGLSLYEDYSLFWSTTLHLAVVLLLWHYSAATALC